MKDPYKVLGVSRNASDDEIKKAYRDLARKYHPDNYHDNPLADLAQEKMKEINEAYDTLTKNKRSGNYNQGSSSTAGAYQSYDQSYAGSDAGIFAQVRSAINYNDLPKAEHLLNTITNRNAEWNFLMGSVCYRKGWLDEANTYFRNAVNMDPSNAEYRQALNFMNSGGYAYRPANSGDGDSDLCSCCSSLLVADCCCECMGGDLISCC